MKLDKTRTQSLFLKSILLATFIANAAVATNSPRFTITNAISDDQTVTTKAIQAVIDQCAKAGGGTVVLPQGEFVSGALFLKPGVNLELADGAVLKVSTNIADFPTLPNVRFEGHFAEHATSLLNLDHCDHFRLTGPGMLDGNGAAYWNAKLPLGRPRLAEICNSRDVIVSGMHFSNSPSWNLHLYNCSDSVVENCRFEISPKGKGPSTDGVDIDSSQNITVKSCFFNVNDDCVCLKGNRYDGLEQEPKSPAVKNVLVTDCTFVRGMGGPDLGNGSNGHSRCGVQEQHRAGQHANVPREISPGHRRSGLRQCPCA